jgi:hypothetical protein
VSSVQDIIAIGRTEVQRVSSGFMEIAEPNGNYVPRTREAEVGSAYGWALLEFKSNWWFEKGNEGQGRGCGREPPELGIGVT